MTDHASAIRAAGESLRNICVLNNAPSADCYYRDGLRYRRPADVTLEQQPAEKRPRPHHKKAAPSMFYENCACYAATCSTNYRDAVAAPSPTSHCGGDVFNVKTSDSLFDRPPHGQRESYWLMKSIFARTILSPSRKSTATWSGQV